jgi:translation initiation factor 3 subunit E
MADSAPASGSVAEQYSLLPKLMPNLDRHLIYPLLNFSLDEEAEQPLEQKKMLLELLKPTNMTDFVGQLHQDVHNLDDVPDEYTKKKDEVLQRRDQLEAETSKISGLLDDENVVTNLRSDKVQNLAYLKDTHDVTVEMVNQLYEFGSFQYSCGVYPHAAELLYRFRVLVRLYIYMCLTIVFALTNKNRPQTTTRSARPPGASSPARSSPSTGTRPSRRSTSSRRPSTPASSITPSHS